MREVRIALVGGAGWMGKTHALIYASAPVIFGNEPARPVLEIVAEATDEIAQKVPLGRLGTSADVAKVCLFLASDLSSYGTGSVISVNGGLLIF